MYDNLKYLMGFSLLQRLMYVLQVPNAEAKKDEKVSFLPSSSNSIPHMLPPLLITPWHSLAPFVSRRLRIVPLLSFSNQNTHKAIDRSHL
jgi:hypothetical protein